MMTIDEVFDSWQTSSIQGVKSPDVVDMLTALQKQWPTQSVASFLKEYKLPENQKQFLSEYDKEHGYVFFAEGSDDLDSESMEARVWQRSNGHQLFGVSFFQPSAKEKGFVVFYDFDPSSKTMTPEPDVFTPFKSSYSNTELGYQIYPEGDELVANEYFFNWWDALRHVYSWDGMKFNGPETEFEGISMILDEFNESYMTYEMGEFSKYALYDVDEDGEPEMFLSTDNGINKAVLSIVEGEIKLVAGTDFKRHLIFYNGVIGDAGGCGTGCYYTHYTKLKKSAPEFELNDLQSYNFETDDMDHEYYKDEELLTEEEGWAIEESFGEILDDPELEWHPLKLWEEE